MSTALHWLIALTLFASIPVLALFATTYEPERPPSQEWEPMRPILPPLTWKED